jgi:hypothetical protein
MEHSYYIVISGHLRSCPARLDSRAGIWVVLELLEGQYGEQAISSRLAIRGCKCALFILFSLRFLVAPAARAQAAAAPVASDRGPERGREWEIWTGAGGDPIGTPKVTLGNSIWTVGARYGWVLTDAHGPRIAR